MRGLHKTDIEKSMRKILESNGIDLEFVEQYPIRSKYGYIADFYLPLYKVIIECDGEAWHKKNNLHDIKRDGFLKSKGIVVLRFTGSEIKNKPLECYQKILEAIIISIVERRKEI